MLQRYNEQQQKNIQATCLYETLLEKYHPLNILNCISQNDRRHRNIDFLFWVYLKKEGGNR